MPAYPSWSPGRLRPSAALFAAAATVVGVVMLPSDAAADPDPPGVVSYLPPVSAPVVDPFRPPATPYGPGNRGIEYDTVPGDAVVSAAPGAVVFAGAVGGGLHVTVQHDDGVRTSYSFLLRIETAVRRRVEQGELIGVAGDTFHFGARLGNAYVDPSDLFDAGPTAVRLVPHESPFPDRSQASGAAWRLPVLGLGLPTVAPALALGPLVDVYHVVDEWRTRRATCTPPTLAVPAHPAGRRVAVLVGGLGSSSAEAAVTAVDTGALGFAPGDVVRFSYAGGRVPGTGAAISGIASHPYAAADTLGDIRVAGERLAGLLAEVAAVVPDARIEIIAHSLGGLVSRVALGRLVASGPLLARIGLIATIGSPHQGADLATLVGHVRRLPGGAAALEGVQDAVGLEIEPDASAVAQLAEGSPFLRELAGEGLPDGVPLLSLAARSDLVVAAPRARLDGAANVIVPVEGVWSDHERLPSSPAVTREIGLAAAGLGPTCEGLFDVLADATVGSGIGWAESGFGLVPGAGAAA